MDPPANVDAAVSEVDQREIQLNLIYLEQIVGCEQRATASLDPHICQFLDDLFREITRKRNFFQRVFYPAKPRATRILRIAWICIGV